MDVTPEEFRAMAALPFQRKVIGIEFPHIYSMFETNRRVAHLLLERSREEYGRPQDMLALFRIVDLTSRCRTTASVWRAARRARPSTGR